MIILNHSSHRSMTKKYDSNVEERIVRHKSYVNFSIINSYHNHFPKYSQESSHTFDAYYTSITALCGYVTSILSSLKQKLDWSTYMYVWSMWLGYLCAFHIIMWKFE